MTKHLLAGLLFLVVSACGKGGSSNAPQDAAGPPPMPDNAVSENFHRRSPSAYVADPPDEPVLPPSDGTSYWGVKAGEALPITWEDLMPAGSGEALEKEYAEFYKALEARYAALSPDEGLDVIEEGSELDYMPQLGGFDTVPELDGMLIRIPGYVVPFDFDLNNKQSSFLLAPYMGACIHTPPPPPNQIIHVNADPAVKIDDIWTAYWLEGTLRTETQESDLAAAAYTLELTKIEPYSVP